ncbi:MAG: hypothetical protein ACE141_12895 [Bryobacteraceae bacterium]
MYRLAIALCVSLSLGLTGACGASIGIALANGSFRVDSHLVVGNATVFEGNTLETDRASSELELNAGVHVRLAANSRGRVFGDRLELQKGLSEVDGGKGYWIEALGLRIRPDQPGSSGRVALAGGGKVQALALRGSMRVSASDGTVVALLAPGTALEFQPQDVTGAQAPFQMTGCLERRDGRYVLRDPISGVTEEVRGERLANEVGRMVEVTATVIPGATPVAGALEVIQISRMRRVSGECVLPAEPAATPAAPPAARPAAAPPRASTPPAPPQPRPGMSAGSKAVIAGVIVGGAAAGGVVYWKTSQNEDKGTISR